MTDIQTWIENNYTEDICKELTDLYIDEKDLEGEVDLETICPRLERIFISNKSKLLDNYELRIAEITENDNLKGFKIKKKTVTKIYPFTPAQDWLEQNYAEDKRAGIEKLDLRQKGLRGSLDLADFTELKELELNLDCNWFRHGKNSNHLLALDLTENKQLTSLTLTDCFGEMNLSIFAPLTKLEKLNISGSRNYPAKFTGSFKSLKDLTSLQSLDISFNSNITDLEALPLEKLTEFKFTGTDWEKTLEPYDYDILAWKLVNHPESISEDKEELLKELNDHLEICRQSLKEIKKTEQIAKISRQESKIELLSEKNSELLNG